MRRAAMILALLLELASLCGCGGDIPWLSRPPRTDPSWVDVYDPRAASPGYNLTLFRRHRPLLIDLNGNTVHAWDVVAYDRVRLLRDGHLLAIGTDATVREYDWDGDVVWEWRAPGEDIPHHDVIRLENGNRLLLLRDETAHCDYLLEVDDAGRTVWEWRTADRLAADIARTENEARAADGTIDLAHQLDITHVNSIRELPPNHWFDHGDTRFRPGNILVSARNLNAIYVIDKATREVVWRFDHRLDHQHEATMTPPGLAGAGNILLFNNGLEDRYAYRSSAVIEIDPSTGAEVWSYSAPNFFSSVEGTQQVLPNGNVMVTSSRGGRVFEITRDGRIVWQWTPAYRPMRDGRYPSDHCPQLAKLGGKAPSRVDRRGPHHVDADLYRFALAHQSVRTKIDDRDRFLLKRPNVCRVVLFPERPKMTVKFGFTNQTEAALEIGAAAAVDGAGPRSAALGPIDVKASVRLTPAGQAQRTVFERDLHFTADRRHSSHFEEANIDVHEYALVPVEICFTAQSSDGGAPDARFAWLDPSIRSARDTDESQEVAGSPEQQAEREKRLRALGYAD